MMTFGWLFYGKVKYGEMLIHRIFEDLGLKIGN